MHVDKPNAVFQAASQFNCLEFPSYEVLPEHGITGYEDDATQGPACAMACAAGTLYRNYFAAVPRSPRPGQSKEYQLNNLDELETYLSNHRNQFFYVRNGYSFSSYEGLEALNAHLRTLLTSDSDDAWDKCRRRIKVGLQEDVGVTFDRNRRVIVRTGDEEEVRVTQVYCSAISCAYSGLPTELWEPLARLVLEAMYEGTLLAAALNMIQKEEEKEREEETETERERERDGDRQSFHDEVFLTFVGGGVFGNRREWIAEAMGRAIAMVEKKLSQHYLPLRRDGSPRSTMKLKVNICHYRQIDARSQRLIEEAYRKFSS